MSSLGVTMGRLELPNPLLAASGTYGFGDCYQTVVPPDVWGGICLKTLTLEPREGNRGVRIAETHGGLLNSIGLANPGVESFKREIAGGLGRLGTRIIASIAGNCAEDYRTLAMILSNDPAVDAIEVNLSCPNVSAGGLAFGADPRAVQKIVSAVRHATSLPVWAKLTPNVASIAEVTKAAESGGADAVVMGNTFLGMEIDIERRQPVFNRTYAGLSGPAIFPLALRCVHQAAQATSLPVIGSGGISDAQDVKKMILAGAVAVELGTVNFTNPDAPVRILKELQRWVDESGTGSISLLSGAITYKAS